MTVKKNPGAWIRFLERPPGENKRTREWLVTLAERAAPLAQVKWFNPWRRYAFFPYTETVWEEDCLRTVAEFCEKQTAARRAERAREREEGRA